ncbi:MAG: NADH-quinone oxidoreductase subunit J [Aliifodinibius sp.]|nr:NADH-quinone oxidoreductase subunit J [Fodinibius sp.]NIV11365.1 NADH-quinone oxidoreductase subunit J [Fodinibius sp.]NIY24999.1 NADH-quinone oxidoreductase subunit J [Fodinibius sp.]
MLELILFWVFAILAVAGGLGVVIHPNPIKSALLLILTFFALAGEYVLLMAHFIAIVHVAVYAGAIMVLFLFVIMLLNIQEETRTSRAWTFMRYVGMSMAILLFTEIGYFGFKGFRNAYVNETDLGTVERVGQALFSQYVLPFEVASILLLVAMVGAVYLSKRKLQLGQNGKIVSEQSATEEPSVVEEHVSQK